MLQHSIEKDDLLQTIDAIITLLNPEDANRMARALQLYREGNVYNIFIEENVLEGTIQDEGNIVTAQIPLLDVETAHCDCMGAHLCEHILALVFGASASFGLVGEFMKRFKNKGKVTNVLKEIKTAKQLLQTAPYEETNTTSWRLFFEKEYETFYKEQQRYPFRMPYFYMNLFEEFYQKLIRRGPKQPILARLFKMHATFFCHEKLLESLATEHLYSYYNPILIEERFMDEMFYTVDQLAKTMIPMEWDYLLTETAAVLHNYLFLPYPMLLGRFTTYRHVWDRVLPTSLVEDEKKRIELVVEHDLKPFALVHFLFAEGNDDKAIAALPLTTHLFISLLFYWIEYVTIHQQTERTRKWISYTYEQLKIYLRHNVSNRQETVQYFLQLYEVFAEQANERPGYEIILQELLPYSYHEYSLHLIDQEEYRRWIELQMFFHTDPLSHMDVIKEIERDDREIVLPLYHQAVMTHIQQKNRASYREAVRYLKKLRTSYKKLKRTEDWDRFITKLSSDFSRLRALQEEMRKGKLIDATN